MAFRGTHESATSVFVACARLPARPHSIKEAPMYRNSGWTNPVLVAAIALALHAPAAEAAVGTLQLPGMGRIVSGEVSAGIVDAGTQTITIGNAGSSGSAT